MKILEILEVIHQTCKYFSLELLEVMENSNLLYSNG